MKNLNCTVCNEINTGSKMVQCSYVKCGSWTHYECDTELKSLTQQKIESKGFKYKCCLCKSKLGKPKVTLFPNNNSVGDKNKSKKQPKKLKKPQDPANEVANDPIEPERAETKQIPAKPKKAKKPEKCKEDPKDQITETFTPRVPKPSIRFTPRVPTTYHPLSPSFMQDSNLEANDSPNADARILPNANLPIEKNKNDAQTVSTNPVPNASESSVEPLKNPIVESSHDKDDSSLIQCGQIPRNNQNPSPNSSVSLTTSQDTSWTDDAETDENSNTEIEKTDSGNSYESQKLSKSLNILPPIRTPLIQQTVEPQKLSKSLNIFPLVENSMKQPSTQSKSIIQTQSQVEKNPGNPEIVKNPAPKGSAKKSKKKIGKKCPDKGFLKSSDISEISFSNPYSPPSKSLNDSSSLEILEKNVLTSTPKSTTSKQSDHSSDKLLAEKYSEMENLIHGYQSENRHLNSELEKYKERLHQADLLIKSMFATERMEGGVDLDDVPLKHIKRDFLKQENMLLTYHALLNEANNFKDHYKNALFDAKEKNQELKNEIHKISTQNNNSQINREMNRYAAQTAKKDLHILDKKYKDLQKSNQLLKDKLTEAQKMNLSWNSQVIIEEKNI